MKKTSFFRERTGFIQRTFSKHRESSAGFTIMEAVIYAAILGQLAIMLSTISFLFIKSRRANEANRVTYQESRFVVDRIIHRIRNAPGIDSGSSLFNNQNGKLVLKAQNAASNLIQLYLQNGTIYEKLGSATATPLTSDKINATELRFGQLVSGDVQSSIDVSLTLTYVNQQKKELAATTTLNAQVSMRNNFPFAWTQSDWSGGPGQTTWSDPTRYTSDDTRADYIGCSGNMQLGTNDTEVVLHQGIACYPKGNFRRTADATAAEGNRIEDMPDQGLRVGGHFGNAAESNPQNYVDMGFMARVNTRYRVWTRYKVINTIDAGTSDSMYLQFNDSLSDNATPSLRIPINRIGTSEGLVQSAGTAGWEWNDIWNGVTTQGNYFYVATSGIHTIRVQRREDGDSLDQITVSAGTYLNSAPSNSTIISLKYATSTTFVSSAFDAGMPTVFGQLFWSGITPTSTSVKFQVKSAPDQASLAFASWTGPAGIGDYYTTSSLGLNTVHDGDQWIQYRAIIETTDTKKTPIISSVTITYSQ
jgi:hypothetical protein